MKVDVAIDNPHARVKVLQIFDSHTNQVLEGKYLFALPPQSSIADFAVWDGDLRLPGVILEKRRADQLYSEIKNQEIDPGLLQQDDERGGTSAFSARVFHPGLRLEARRAGVHRDAAGRKSDLAFQLPAEAILRPASARRESCRSTCKRLATPDLLSTFVRRPTR